MKQNLESFVKMDYFWKEIKKDEEEEAEMKIICDLENFIAS